MGQPNMYRLPYCKKKPSFPVRHRCQDGQRTKLYIPEGLHIPTHTDIHKSYTETRSTDVTSQKLGWKTQGRLYRYTHEAFK